MIRPGVEAEFVEKYGPEGLWARLFRKSDGYIRTELVKDVAAERRFLTLDYWKSEEEFNNFRKQHLAEYERLDKEFEGLTGEERRLGVFWLGTGMQHTGNKGTNFDCLKSEWDNIFRPLPTREASVKALLGHLIQLRIKNYDYEGLLRYLSGPSGPITHGTPAPSPMDRYRVLSDGERELLQHHIDKTLDEARKLYPEAFNEYDEKMNGQEQVFFDPYKG